MTTKGQITFEASAHLQRLIGRELVPNEEMAIVELVKNAYDSSASRVNILIQPETTREPGYVRISDDGTGMSVDSIKSLFMFAGYSDRPDQLRRKRVPTGEKGIGRFAADKLGDLLDVFTREKGQTNGIHLAIDWRAFNSRIKKFNEVKAVYDIRPTPEVPYEHGTTLEITRIRTAWTPEKLQRLRLWLSELFNPFHRPPDFEVTLEVANARTGMAAITPEIPDADLQMEIEVRGNGRLYRSIQLRDADKPLLDENVTTSADLEYLDGLKATFLYFNKRPNRKVSRGLESGIRVYRDGFRIEPFGSRSADWLGIAEKRAKRAGHAHIVPSRLFGFVEISRKSNPQLGDTTSRQALLDSAAATNMVGALREQLEVLEDHLRAKAEPRWKESKRVKAIAVEQARLHTLGVVSFGLAHELRQPLQSIRSEAHNIKTRLAQLGVLNDKLIIASQDAIDRGIDRVDKNIKLVSDISTGSVENEDVLDLAELVRNEVSLLSHKCKTLGVTLALDAPVTQPAKTNWFAVSTVLVNYVQNALDSISASGQPGQIDVTLKRKGTDHFLEVADNGPGVPAEIQPNLFKSFATRKTGGMGVGLYYCKTVIESHGGEVGFASKRKGARFWMRLPEGD